MYSTILIRVKSSPSQYFMAQSSILSSWDHCLSRTPSPFARGFTIRLSPPAVSSPSLNIRNPGTIEQAPYPANLLLSRCHYHPSPSPLSLSLHHPSSYPTNLPLNITINLPPPPYRSTIPPILPPPYLSPHHPSLSEIPSLSSRHHTQQSHCALDIRSLPRVMEALLRRLGKAAVIFLCITGRRVDNTFPPLARAVMAVRYLCPWFFFSLL